MNEGLHLFGADLSNLRVKSVDVPEAFKCKVENARFKTEIVLIIADHVQYVTASFLTDKITQTAVIGFLHRSDLVEL